MTASPNSQWVAVSGFLKTTAPNVWQLLTDPQLTERYMYNCQLHSDWKVGSTAVWKAQEENGNWVPHVKAQVLVYEPCRHLAFTIFHEATDQRPEIQSELHFLLEPKGDGINLTINQGDFGRLELDNVLYKQCQQGWDYVMPQLLDTAKAVFDKPT